MRTTLSPIIFLVVFGLLTSSCSGGDDPSPSTDAVAPGDGASSDLDASNLGSDGGEGIVENDTSAEEDTANVDGNNTEKDANSTMTPGFGVPCEGNQDCPDIDGLCIDGPDGSVCTQICLESCPSDWMCKGVSGVGGDLIFVCVPNEAQVCKTCAGAEDCALPTLCTAHNGLGDLCMNKCAGAGEFCPDGFECKEEQEKGANAPIWVCTPVEPEGCCAQRSKGAWETCETTNVHGSCSGSRICQGKAGWSPCNATIPMAEACDRLDNDCDNATDEGMDPNCLCGDGMCQISYDENLETCPEDC